MPGGPQSYKITDKTIMNVGKKSDLMKSCASNPYITYALGVDYLLFSLSFFFAGALIDQMGKVSSDTLVTEYGSAVRKFLG